MLSCIWRWMQIDEWVCKQSMMRCDVWRVWMNDLWKTWSKQKDESDEYGGNKPLLMIIDQCFTMQRWIGKIDLYAPEYSRRRKLERYELLDECGWISVQQAMTDASNSRWHWSCPQTLSLNVSSWFILIFWIYLILWIIFYLLLAVALIVLVKKMKLMLACCDLFSKWIFTQWVDMRLFDCMHIIWGKRICWKYWCLMFPCMALAKSPKLSISTFLSGGVILCITAAQCVYHGIT